MGRGKQCILRIHYLQYAVLAVFHIHSTRWIHSIMPILQIRHREIMIPTHVTQTK